MMGNENNSNLLWHEAARDPTNRHLVSTVRLGLTVLQCTMTGRSENQRRHRPHDGNEQGYTPDEYRLNCLCGQKQPKACCNP